MADQSPTQLRKTAKLMKGGAALAVVGAVVALAIVLARGESVLQILPVALMMLVVAGASLAAAGGMEKKAVEAERSEPHPPAR